MMDSTDASKAVEFEPFVRLVSASAKSVVKKSIVRWVCGVSGYLVDEVCEFSSGEEVNKLEDLVSVRGPDEEERKSAMGKKL